MSGILEIAVDAVPAAKPGCLFWCGMEALKPLSLNERHAEQLRAASGTVQTGPVRSISGRPGGIYQSRQWQESRCRMGL